MGQQVEFDGAGYLAVALDMIFLPGIYPQTNYDPARDWCFPGTQDAIEDAAWQAAAKDFAGRYNFRRDAAAPPARPTP